MSTGLSFAIDAVEPAHAERHPQRWTVGLWAGCCLASIALLLERLFFGSAESVPVFVACAVSVTVTTLTVFVGVVVNYHDVDGSQRYRNVRAILTMLPSAVVASAFVDAASSAISSWERSTSWERWCCFSSLPSMQRHCPSQL